MAMDAIRFLKQQHDEAKAMFGQIEQASGQQRGALWKKLEPELKLHEQIEEAHLYGPVAEDTRVRDSTLREWNAHHHEEVGEAESMIAEIGGLNPPDTEWMEMVTELKETLEHHIQEEEQQIWPKIQQVWDRSKLEEVGAQMEAMKQREGRRAA
jgi:iron-sulfur cluster repair protein YtfE (RIC family)